MTGLSDLEGTVCDVADMAIVAEILTGKAIEEMAAAAQMNISAAKAAKATAYWRDAAAFAVLHLKGMTENLRKEFYAEIEKGAS